MKRPHEVLEIPVSASQEDIKRAYRRAAMQHHPDRGGNARDFEAIQKAYEALQNKKCPVCGGSGFVKTRQAAFVVKNPCPKCWGTDI